MLKILLTLLLLSLVATYDYSKVASKIDDLGRKNLRIKQLENELARTQKRLKECQDRNIGKTTTIYTEDKSLTERLRNRIYQLQDQVKSLISKAASKIDDEDSILYKFKLKIEELEKKVKGETQKSESLNSQKTSLQRKIDEYRSKADEFSRKINDLVDESLNKGKIHLAEIQKLKQDYQGKIKNTINAKCDSLSDQLLKKDEQCKKEVKTYGEKIRDLERTAVQKAKEFAEKVVQTKNSVTTRIKNFLTGRGPYTKEEQEAFAEFKERVSSLQGKIQQRLSDIDRIRKEKQDIEFQQRYCKAQLTDYNQEIQELQRQAISTGKRYYIDELKKIAKERPNCKVIQSNDEINKSYQQKITLTEDKLRKQLEENQRLYRERRTAQEKTQKCLDDAQKARIKAESTLAEMTKLKSKNQELERLLKQIYSLKDK